MLEEEGKRPRALRLSPGIRWVCCCAEIEGSRTRSEQAAKHAKNHSVCLCVWVCAVVFTKTHVHGCDIILVGFPDLLHDLQLGPAAAFNGAFDRNGSLRVVQREVLKAARGQEGQVFFYFFLLNKLP